MSLNLSAACFFVRPPGRQKFKFFVKVTVCFYRNFEWIFSEKENKLSYLASFEMNKIIATADILELDSLP